MGQFVRQRTQFVRAVNQAFSAAQIANTLERLRPLPRSADALDIMNMLGLLTWVEPGQFDLYRRSLRIPHLNMRILTLAFRSALLARPRPLPVAFSIVEGKAEAVSVTVTAEHISIGLTRTGLDPLLKA